jgi:hypothetical protein
MRTLRLFLFLLALAFSLPLQSQSVTNTILDSPSAPASAPRETIPDKPSHIIPQQDAAWLKSQGWTDEQIASAVPVQNIGETQDTYNQLTNYYHTAHFNNYRIGSLQIFVPTSPEDQTSTISIVPTISNRKGYAIPPEDIPFLKQQGWTDEEIANYNPQPVGTVNGQPQTNQVTMSTTPPDLKNAIIYVDNFLGSGKTGFPADVISIKKGALKFRIGAKDFDYSGNFSILLTTPRQHKHPYLGLGKPETVKLLILEDFFKGEADGTMPLPNATIWEKSEGYIVATGADKEWIHSGTYTIQN